MQIEREGRGDDGTEQSIGAIYSQMSVQIEGEGRGGYEREHPTVPWKTREDKVGETRIMDVT